MDEENKNLDTSTDESSDSVSDASDDIVQEDKSPEPHIIIDNTKDKKSKKPLIIVLVLLIIAALIGVGYWFLNKDKQQATNSTQDSQTSQNQVTEDAGPKPSALAYSYGNPDDTGLELFWRPLDGGDRSSAKNVGQKNYIIYSDVYKNQVYVVTSPSSGSSDGVAIWHSNDSGQTYEQLVELALPQPDSMGEQITSAAFSKDGTKIVFGYLGESAKGNTVRQIDLKTKEVSDLFTVNTAGVFLQGFDSEKQLIYYYTGCFNCDGVTFSKLFVRDLSSKVETVVYDSPGKYGMGQKFNSDMSKFLVIEGSPSNEGIGGGAPYTVKELDVAKKTFANLLTVEEGGDMPSKPGYRDGDSVPYIALGKSVFALAQDGTKTQLFEADKPITDVLFVGKDQVVAAAGTYESYIVTNFVISTQSSTKVLEGDQSARLFGVVWQ